MQSVSARWLYRGRSEECETPCQHLGFKLFGGLGGMEVKYASYGIGPESDVSDIWDP